MIFEDIYNAVTDVLKMAISLQSLTIFYFSSTYIDVIQSPFPVGYCTLSLSLHGETLINAPACLRSDKICSVCPFLVFEMTKRMTLGVIYVVFFFIFCECKPTQFTRFRWTTCFWTCCVTSSEGHFGAFAFVDAKKLAVPRVGYSVPDKTKSKRERKRREWDQRSLENSWKCEGEGEGREIEVMRLISCFLCFKSRPLSAGYRQLLSSSLCRRSLDRAPLDIHTSETLVCGI